MAEPRKRVRRMSMTTFEALTPNSENQFNFDDFENFLTPEENDIHKNYTIINPKKKPRRKSSMKEALETIHQTDATKPKSKPKRQIKTVKLTKTEKNLKSREKPNYQESYMNFLSHFKKQNCPKVQIYDPDRFFDHSMLNKLEVRNLQPCLRKRCKVIPKTKFDDYRMKDQAEVKFYYEQLNNRMIKRSSHSLIQNNTQNQNVYPQYSEGYCQNFLLFRKAQQNLTDNLNRMGIEDSKQERMMNRFFESHLLVKGKLSEAKSKHKKIPV